MEKSVTDPLKIEKICRQLKGEPKDQCIKGMSMRYLLHHGEVDEPLQMCATLKKDESALCEETVDFLAQQFNM